MNKPNPPHPDFPLGAWPNGQWGKKINKKPYYFGSWKDDPKGERAIREYQERLPGILAGTDHLRHLAGGADETTVADLVREYLAERRVDVKSGTMSLSTYADYSKELAAFADWIKGTTAAGALKPEHFAGYARHLAGEGDDARHCQSRARRRIFSYVKAAFRWGAGNGKFALPNFGTAFKCPPTSREAIRKEKARAGKADHSGRIVTGEEVDKMLAIAQPNFRAMILLAINCGLGPADLGRLRWRHLGGVAMAGAKLDYPRFKTGNDRHGFLWKRTREALAAVARCKHTAAAIARDGEDALVFVTRKQQPYYAETEVIEGGRVVGVKITNAISITIGRLAKRCELVGVTAYRFRHTFKTLGKKAKDRDALNLAMGHRSGGAVEATYDHERIEFARVKRVALKVKRRLWPAESNRDGRPVPVGAAAAGRARPRSAA